MSEDITNLVSKAWNWDLAEFARQTKRPVNDQSTQDAFRRFQEAATNLRQLDETTLAVLISPKEPPMAIYQLEEVQPGKVIVSLAGDPALTLEGGYTGPITLSYLNHQRHSQRRADDYMAGVFAGCVHMTMLPPEARPMPKPSQN